MQDLVIIALDIEGRGASAVRNGIVSIGCCVWFQKTGAFEKRRFDIQPYAGQIMEEKCKVEFWDKQGDLLYLLQSQALFPHFAMPEFRRYIDQWQNVYIISDTPAYDFYFINYYLDRESLPLLQFDRDGNFRPTHDADSYARGKYNYSIDRQWFSNSDVPDVNLPANLRAHLPEDDAHTILMVHLRLNYIPK